MAPSSATMATRSTSPAPMKNTHLISRDSIGYLAKRQLGMRSLPNPAKPEPDRKPIPRRDAGTPRPAQRKPGIGWRNSANARRLSRPWLVEVLLKAGENVADLFRSAQVGPGVGDGVVVLQFQQGRQLSAVQLLDANLDVLRQHEPEEDPLLRGEAGAHGELGARGSFLAGQRRQGVS